MDNLELYNQKCFQHELMINPDYQKDNGIYYTDVNLATKIIDFLNIPNDASILDPCCGVGSFLFSSARMGNQKNYGADFDKKAVRFCLDQDIMAQVVCYDTIGNSGKDVLSFMHLDNQVDYVIGNPPYVPLSKNVTINSTEDAFLRKVTNSGNNLFIGALYRAFELAKPNGYIAYIVPKNLLHVTSYKEMRNVLLHKKRIVSIIDIGAYFKNVRGEQIVLIVQNEYLVGNNINLYKLDNFNFKKQAVVPQDFYQDEILLFNTETDFEVYKKLETRYDKLSSICKGFIGRGKSLLHNAITGKDIRKFGLKQRMIPEEGNQIFIQNIFSTESGIIATFGGNLAASQTVTVLTDSDAEMCTYILGLLHSRLVNYYLIKFCYNSSKLTMHTDAKYLKKIPFVVNDRTYDKIRNLVIKIESIDYMSLAWFNAIEDLNLLVYETYDISQKMAYYIDSEMKKIQSKRWYLDN